MVGIFSVIIPSLFVWHTTCSILNVSYSHNFVFTVSNSPYFIEENVVFESTADVIVENGVEIIFNGNYYIEIFGNINCGCNDIAATSTTTKRGLSNSTRYTYIHNNRVMCQGCGWISYSILGWISISNTNGTTTEVKFCNTRFDNNYIGIKWTTPQYTNSIIDHCEFNNLYYATYNNYQDSNYMNSISNTLIHNVNTVNSIGNAIYNNVFIDKYIRFCDDHQCLGVIENYAYCCSNIVIMNSTLNNSSMECLSVSGLNENLLYNNSITNCGRDGIIIPIDTSLLISNNHFMNIINNAGFSNAIKNYADNILIENNTFIVNDVDIFLSVIDASNVIIRNNQFSYNEQYCIVSIWGSNSRSKIIIENNEFKNNGQHSIGTAIIFVYSADIIDNHFEDNLVLESLVRMNNADNATISGNTMQSNHVNTSDYALIYVTGNVNVMYNTITNNIVSGSNGFMIFCYGSNVISIENNVLIDNAMRNIGNILGIWCWTDCTNFTIKYNNFYSGLSSNNIETYIDIYITSDVVSFIMQYNNFGNYQNVVYFLEFNIYYYHNVETLDVNNNAFISMSDINTIDSKIRDGCDTFWKIIEYSPWYIEAIDFKNLANLPIEHTTNFICGKTPNPTRSPTETTFNPSTSIPTTYSPTTDNPTTNTPTTSSPTTSNPTTSMPTTFNPTTSYPTTSNPTTSNPTTAQPSTAIPTTAQPTTTNPTTAYPTTANPTTANLTTANPTTSNPTTANPTTANPTTANPTAANPTTTNPTTSNPTISIPTTSAPSTTYQTTSNPTTANPTTSNPTTFTPTTSNPTTSNSTTSNPTTSNPTASNPTTFTPTTSNSTKSNPTTSNPTTSNPTTSTPTTSTPTTSNSTISNPTTDSDATTDPSKIEYSTLIILLLIALVVVIILLIVIIIMISIILRRNQKQNKKVSDKEVEMQNIYQDRIYAHVASKSYLNKALKTMRDEEKHVESEEMGRLNDTKKQ